MDEGLTAGNCRKCCWGHVGRKERSFLEILRHSYQNNRQWIGSTKITLHFSGKLIKWQLWTEQGCREHVCRKSVFFSFWELLRHCSKNIKESESLMNQLKCSKHFRKLIGELYRTAGSTYAWRAYPLVLEIKPLLRSKESAMNRLHQHNTEEQWSVHFGKTNEVTAGNCIRLQKDT